MLERLVLAALGSAPASLIARARTASRGGRVLGKLVTVASRRLAGRPAAVRHGPAQGLRLQVEPRSLAWLTGKVEREVQAALVARLKPGDIVVDAGASIGFHSLLAAQLVGPSGTVIASSRARLTPRRCRRTPR